MPTKALTEVFTALRQTQQSFLEVVDQANDQVLYRRPAKDSWTLAEVLVHMAEARQFFTGEIHKILTTSQTKIGRLLDNPQRLQTIEDHGQDSLETIRQQLIDSHEAMLDMLNGLAETDLEKPVEHIAYGQLTLEAFIQRFLIGHDQVHVEQSHDLLAGKPASE